MKTRLPVLLTCVVCLLFPIAVFPASAQSGDGNDGCLVAAPEFAIQARIGRGAINDLVVSPDGSLLAVASSRGIWLYESDSLELRSSLLLPEESAVTSVSWSPGGNALAAGYEDGLRIWSVEREAVSWWYPKIPDVTHVSWSPSGYRLAVLNAGFVDEGMTSVVYSDLRVMTAYEGRVLIRETDLLRNSNQAFWSPEGTRLLYLNSNTAGPSGNTAYSPPDDRAVIWFEDGMEPDLTFTGTEDDPLPILSAAWSPDGTRVALSTGEFDSAAVQIRDSQTGEILETLPGGRNAMWSANGATFAVYQEFPERGLRLYDGTLENERFIPTGFVQQFILSPDGSRLYAHQSGTLVAYDTANGTVVASLDQHPSQNLEATWTPNGSRLVTRHGSDPDGNAVLFIWTAAGAYQGRVHSEGTVNGMSWSPDGNRLALVKSDTVHIVGLGGTIPVKIPAEDPSRLAWSPDGGQLAAILESGDVYVWDAISGEEINHLPSPVEGLSWSSKSLDSRIVWSDAIGLRWSISDRDGVIRVYAADQAEPLADLSTLAFNYDDETPAFLPDGRLYYTLDGDTFVYDVETGTVVAEYDLRGRAGQQSFSPGFGCYALAGIAESVVFPAPPVLSLYRLDDNTVLNRLVLPQAVEDTYRSGSAIWSSDGRQVAVILDDGTLLLAGVP
jgi:WD40 repeat protein